MTYQPDSRSIKRQYYQVYRPKFLQLYLNKILPQDSHSKVKSLSKQNSKLPIIERQKRGKSVPYPSEWDIGTIVGLEEQDCQKLTKQERKNMIRKQQQKQQEQKKIIEQQEPITSFGLLISSKQISKITESSRILHTLQSDKSIIINTNNKITNFNIFSKKEPKTRLKIISKESKNQSRIKFKILQTKNESKNQTRLKIKDKNCSNKKLKITEKQKENNVRQNYWKQIKKRSSCQKKAISMPTYFKNYFQYKRYMSTEPTSNFNKQIRFKKPEMTRLGPGKYLNLKDWNKPKGPYLRL